MVARAIRVTSLLPGRSLTLQVQLLVRGRTLLLTALLSDSDLPSASTLMAYTSTYALNS